MAQAEVYEVASFYAHFDIVREGETPPPALTVRVCDSLTCEMMGARRLLAELPEALGPKVRVVHAPCMGRCDTAPVVHVGHHTVDRASVASVRAAVTAGHVHPAIPRYTDYDAYVAEGGYALARRLSRRRAHGRRDHQDHERLGAARPGRRGLSDRAQMEPGARRAGAAPRRHQRRRGRARDVQGPVLSRDRPAPLHRGRLDRRVGRRGRCRLHLSPRRIPAYPRDPVEGDRQGRARGPDAAHQAASPARRRRLYLRRRVGDDREHRGQARPAAPSPALCRPGRAVRPPDAREQRRDALLGARHRREGRRVVRGPGHERRQGSAQLLGLGPCEESGRQAGARRHHRAGTDRPILRRHGRRPPLRRLSAGRRLGRHLAGQHGESAARFRATGKARRPGRIACRRRAVGQGRSARGRGQSAALLRGRELRPVHALPRRHREGGQAHGRSPHGTRRPCAICARRWPTHRSAASARRRPTRS